MNEVAGGIRTLMSRWTATLLVAVAVVAAAVTTFIVVSGRTVWVSITIRAGSLVRFEPATHATGGLGRGWPPGVWVRARGPPAGVLVTGVVSRVVE